MRACNRRELTNKGENGDSFYAHFQGTCVEPWNPRGQYKVPHGTGQRPVAVGHRHHGRLLRVPTTNGTVPSSARWTRHHRDTGRRAKALEGAATAQRVEDPCKGSTPSSSVLRRLSSHLEPVLHIRVGTGSSEPNYGPQGSFYLPIRRSINAMRTNSPFRIWRKYAARGSSSICGWISLTRGNGCSIAASFFIFDSTVLSIM